MKDEREIREIVAALRQWFISQDVAPPDAAVAMIELAADLLVSKSKDPEVLIAAIQNHKNFLTLEIASRLL